MDKQKVTDKYFYKGIWVGVPDSAIEKLYIKTLLEDLPRYNIWLNIEEDKDGEYIRFEDLKQIIDKWN